MSRLPCRSLIAPLAMVLATVVACSGAQEKEDAPPTQETASKPAPAPEAKPEAKPAPPSEADKYAAWCDERLTKAETIKADLEKGKDAATVDSVLVPFNDIWIEIDAARNRSELMSAVHPDEGVRGQADACTQKVSKLVTEIGLARGLYDRVAAIDVKSADAVTKRHVEHILRDFRRMGVDKDEATREKIKALNAEIVELGQAFGRNIREDVRTVAVDNAEKLAGLPQDFIDAHKAGDDGKIGITTNYPDYFPVMQYAKDDALRLDLYKAFRKRGYPKNIEVLDNLIKKRHELATTLGYKSWADYITEDKMIKSAGAAKAFIDKVNATAKKRAARDYKELLARLKKDDKKAKAVGDWQKTYLEELVKKEKYAFDSQKVREYLTYDKVRKGLFDLTSKMFGVTYKKSDRAAWHESVEAWDVVDGDQVLGHFFLDMHPRDNKYKHAAMFPIVTGVEGRQLPEASLVCNFPAEGPMEFGQARTFFHEFGHLLHHLFAGKQRWVGVGGINTEWDFVEAPSQIFEEWVLDADVLRTFATNEKGEPIPTDLVAALNKADGFGRGLWVRHQMFYASVSLSYYDRDPKKVDTTKLMKGLQGKYSPYAYVDDTFFQTSFGHLDGYSAIYYTYMWSLVIAKDLFSRFEKEGLTNEKVAADYRNKVLAPGGSNDAALLVKDFLGRPYNFKAFGNWLNKK